MADNSLRTPGTGEIIRTLEKASGAYKVPTTVLDIGGTGAESLLSATNPLPTRTNPRRGTLVAHRAAVTAADRLAAPATPTLSGQTVTAGTLASATSYGVVVAAGNALGVTTVNTQASGSPGGSNNALRVTIAQIANATYYDVFLGTTGFPWVARFTETERATGGFRVTAVGTVTSGGSAPAGSVDVGVVGTGLSSASQTFAVNTAYYLGSITAVDLTGYSAAHVYATLTLTDVRTAPVLTLVPFWKRQGTSTYHAGAPIDLALLGRHGGALLQDLVLDADGNDGLILAVSDIAGQGASLNLDVVPV